MGEECRSPGVRTFFPKYTPSHSITTQSYIGSPRNFPGPFRASGEMCGGKGHRFKHSGLLQPSILGPQERRFVPPNHRPLTPQFFPRGPLFQDGNRFFYTGFHSAGRLGGLSRPIGRIFPCADAPIVSEVPQILRESRGLSVSSSSLRDCHGTPNLHETDGYSSRPSTSKRVTCDPIFRRLASVAPGPQCPSVQPIQELDTGDGSRSVGQFRQVRSHTLPGFHLRRNEFPYTSQPGEGTSSSSSGYLPSDRGDSTSSAPVGSSVPLPLRSSERSSGFCSARETACTPSSVLPPVSVVSRERSFVLPHSTSTVHSSPSSMVVGLGSTAGRSSSPSTIPISGPYHRCQSSWMGSPCRTSGSHGAGNLVSSGVHFSYQQSRDEGCLSSHHSLSGCSSEAGCSFVDRQCNSGFLHPKTGGDSLSIPVSRSTEGSSTVQRSRDCSLCEAHSREAECSCGQSVTQTSDSANGVDVGTIDSQCYLRFSRLSSGRLVCHQVEQSSTSLRLSGPGPSSLGDRRSFSGLGQSSCLRLSSVCANTTGDKEGEDFKLSHSACSTSVASKIVVQRSSVSSVRPPAVTSKSTRSSLSKKTSVRSKPPSPKSGHASTSRLAIIRHSLRKKKFSSRAASLIARARRRSTLRVYDAKWNIFVDWCRGQQIDPLDPSPRRVADFLTHLFDVKKLSVSTIKGYRSCIANTLSFRKSRSSIGSNPIISELIRAFELHRPVSHSLAPKWDLSCVLWSLCKEPFEPLVSADLKFLTWKTVFLLTLASAKRRSEIHALSVDDNHLRFNADGSVSFTCEAGFLAKTQLPSVAASPFTIPSLSKVCGDKDSDRFLCPIRALKFYLQRVKPNRHGRKRLFLPLIGKGNISAASISRWIASVIRHAYKSITDRQLPLFNIRPHELRALAASWAYVNHIPLDDVLRAAYWRHSSTFSSFYLRSFSAQQDNLFMLGPIVAAQSVVVDRSTISND